MKRIIAVLLLCISLLFVCSCEIDITDEFNQMSQAIMDQAVNLVGPYLKEDEQFKNDTEESTPTVDATEQNELVPDEY